MANEEPPYLTVGTEVSAKYKGAFCEAKVKKVIRSVRCKVVLKNNMGAPVICQDDHVKGTLRVGAHVEVKQPDKNVYLEGIINKLHDQSQYTVVFDDGDETTLRRTSLCLKSGRHFAESETLDQLPLTHPEHFGTPVMGSKGRKRRSLNRSMNYDSSDDDPPPKKKEAKLKEPDPAIGKVVCVEMGDKKKTKDNWFPALVVSPSAQDSVKVDTKAEHLVRSFKDGKYYCTTKKDTREFTREIGLKVDNNTLKTAVEKASLYTDRDELPPHWDRDILFRTGTMMDDGDSNEESDSDTSDDEPSEEKDRFVAQLYKFMDDRGTPINKAPTVSNRDLNLYKLFKMVQKLGGYNRVTNHMQWKTVYTKMGLPGYNTSSSHQIKQAYKKYLHSFEDFYRKLGCTMGTSTRSGRMRHLSGRGFILTRDRDREFKAAGRKLSSKQEAKEKNREEKKGKEDEKTKVEEKAMETKSRVKEEDKDDNHADDEAEDEDEEERAEQEKMKIKEEKKTKIKKERQEKRSKIEEKDRKNKPEDKEKKIKLDDKTKKSKPEDKEKRSKLDDKKSKPEEKEKKLKIEEKEKKSKADDKEKKHKLEDKEKKCKPEDREKKSKIEDKDKKIKTEEREKRNKIEDKERKSKPDEKEKKMKLDDREKKNRLEDKDPKNKLEEKERRNKLEDRERPNFRPKPRRKLTRDEKHEDGPGGQDTTTDDGGECLSDIDINVGDKVRVKYGRGRQQKIYEAKVLELEEEDGEKHFYVHYTGWNMRYDEWVKRHRIVENLSQKARKGRSAGSPKFIFQMPVSRVPPGKQRGRPPSASGKSPPSNRKSSGNSTVSPRPRITRSDKSSLADSPFAHGLDSRRRTRTMSGLHPDSDEDMHSSMDSDDLDLHFSNNDDTPVESASEKDEIEMEEPKSKRKDRKISTKDKCDISHDDNEEDDDKAVEGDRDDNEVNESQVKELPGSKGRMAKVKDDGDDVGNNGNKGKIRGKQIKKEKIKDDNSSADTARQKRRTRNVRDDSDAEQDIEEKFLSEHKRDDSVEKLPVKSKGKSRRSYKNKADDSDNEGVESKGEDISLKTKFKGKAKRINKSKTSDAEVEAVQESQEVDVPLLTKSKGKSRRSNKVKMDDSDDEVPVLLKEDHEETVIKSKGRSKRSYKAKKDDTEDESIHPKEEDNTEIATKSKGKSKRSFKAQAVDSGDESEEPKGEDLAERVVKTKSKARRSYKVKLDDSEDEIIELKEDDNLDLATKFKGKAKRSHKIKINGSDDETACVIEDNAEPVAKPKAKTRKSVKMRAEDSTAEEPDFKDEDNAEQMPKFKGKIRKSFKIRTDDSEIEAPEEVEKEAVRPKRKGRRKSQKKKDDVDDDDPELDSFDETKLTSQVDSDSDRNENRADAERELLCSDLRPPEIPEGIIVSEDNDDFSFLDGITGDSRQEVDETKEEAMEEAAVLSIMQEEISQETEDGEPFSLNMDICLPSVVPEPVASIMFMSNEKEPALDQGNSETPSLQSEEAIDVTISTDSPKNKELPNFPVDVDKIEDESVTVSSQPDVGKKNKEELVVEELEADTKVKKTKRKSKGKRDKDLSDGEMTEQVETDVEVVPVKRGKQKAIKGGRLKCITDKSEADKADDEEESDIGVPDVVSTNSHPTESAELSELLIIDKDKIIADAEDKKASNSENKLPSNSESKDKFEDSSQSELVNVCSVIASVISSSDQSTESAAKVLAEETVEDSCQETVPESIITKVDDSVSAPDEDQAHDDGVLPNHDTVCIEEEPIVEPASNIKPNVGDISSSEDIDQKKGDSDKSLAKETKKEKSKHVKDEDKGNEFDGDKVDDVKKKKGDDKKVKEGKAKKSKDKKSKSKKDDGLKSDKETPEKKDSEKMKKKESKKKKEAERIKKAERLESDLESGDSLELLKKKKSRKNKLDDKRKDGDPVKKKSKKKTPKEHKVANEERGSEDDTSIVKEGKEGKKSSKKGDRPNKTKKKKDRDKVKKDLFDDHDNPKVKSEKEHKKSEKRSKENAKQQFAESKSAVVSVKQELDSDEMENLLLCKEDVPLSPVAGDSQLYRSDNSLPMCSSQESRYDLSISSVSCLASGSSGNISVSGGTTDECSLQSYMKHVPEQSTVLDNTPPTTPESALSTMSGSIIHDRESASPIPDEETQSTKSGQDCPSYMDLESYAAVSKLACHENVDFAQSEAAMVLGSLGTLQAFDKRPPALVESMVSTTKRLRNDNEDHPPRKRKKSRRRSHSTSEVTKSSSSSSRHRHGMCKMSKTASDSDEALHIDQSHTSAFHQLSQVSLCGGSSSSSSYAGSDREGLLHGLAPRSPRPSKFNFYVELDDYLEGSERIDIIQKKLTELRKTYMALKAEVACIDRRRKKLRRKEKEASTTVSSTTEVECS